MNERGTNFQALVLKNQKRLFKYMEAPQRYYCPECAAPVIWSMNNIKVGATAVISCGNSYSASRVDFDFVNAIFCEWTGVATRQVDGTVSLFLADGRTYLRPRL